MLKKTLIFVSIAALTLMGIAACNGGEGGTTNGEATPSAEVTVNPEGGAASPSAEPTESVATP